MAEIKVEMSIYKQREADSKSYGFSTPSFFDAAPQTYVKSQSVIKRICVWQSAHTTQSYDAVETSAHTPHGVPEGGFSQ